MAKIKGGGKAEEILRNIAKGLAKQPYVRVGFLAGATYPTKVSTAALRSTYAKRKSRGVVGAVRGSVGGISVAMIAAIQDAGAPSRGIPPRPFFRNMIAKKSPQWSKTAVELLKDNNYDAMKVMRLMGEGIAGQLRESINETNSPALSPVTISRKGFSKPLIDTSHLINSVDYEVREKGQ